MADKEKPNLKVLRALRIEGKHYPVGAVISKSKFDSRGDWDDLCRMNPPKLAETEEKIGGEKPAMPGASK